MALCYTRLLCRRNINFHSFRSLYTCSPLNVAVSKPLCMGSTVCETHDEKNARLKRPMSPHLTIYQIQLTSFLSITHRTTGLILSSYAMLLGLGTLFIPGGIPCLIEMTQNLGLSTPLLFLGKTMIAFPATYHTFNGFRHLAWDMGMFLTIKEVYSTGYAVLALSAVSAILLAAL
ncbi:succinate dehydrogenase cytochrome b560 subunit, mitochondrial-like [Colletes gigas]|uniref:succinate dehydrogenase cytochrome b560 subunit, mitochondrial-like n=1 Tax=Colletes gigas TaxID=935657 RepID=UPI001C9ACA4A|nr:succinate dehydrogenase cytochrome b560 subunit, mitochondrial-like [Colletes gigas]XP_043260695.1 succinate dehydrogenase cytochrome b560 subunit, mitochondrial-like [Colletes gigas]